MLVQRKCFGVKLGAVLLNTVILILILVLALTIRQKNEQIQALSGSQERAKIQTTMFSTQLDQLEKEHSSVVFELKKLQLENKILKIRSYYITWMAQIIASEEPHGTDRAQMGVANVVMNRVKSPLFPNTIREVLMAENQYCPDIHGMDCFLSLKPSEQNIRNAERIADGERVFPSNVYWQALFLQGDGLHENIGGELFCYTGVKQPNPITDVR